MRPISKAWRAAAVAALLVGVAGTSLRAAEEPPKKLGWADTAEFSYVATAGNTETQTLGFKDTLTRTWEEALFTLKAGGIRVNTTTFSRHAESVGIPSPASNFDVIEKSDSGLTAENYFLNGRYDHNITKHFFWFGLGGWDRNKFAGIENRYTAAAGVGNIWADSDRRKFRTDYSITYTKQDDVVPDEHSNKSFAGARISWSYLQKFGASTTFTHDTILDENLSTTADWRGNMTNSVSVAMNKRLALKVSLQWLYDHRPSLEKIDLLDVTDPANPVNIGTVRVELDELDTIFTSSLVVNF